MEKTLSIDTPDFEREMAHEGWAWIGNGFVDMGNVGFVDEW